MTPPPTLTTLVNLVTLVMLLSVLIGITVDITRALAHDGRTLRSIAWVFWTLVGFFGTILLGRLEELADFWPGVEVLATVREMAWVWYVILLIAVLQVWDALHPPAHRKD